MNIKNLIEKDSYPESVNRIDGKHVKVSKKFDFVSTNRILARFADKGFLPFNITQNRVIKPENHTYQKHKVLLAYQDDIRSLQVQEKINCVELVNSHMGNASLQLSNLTLRLVCSNGMTVKDATIEQYRLRHIGFDYQKLDKAFNSLVNNFDLINNKIEIMKAKKLDYLSKKEFGYESLKILF